MFKFVDRVAVARLWGERKNVANMPFQKLYKALRSKCSKRVIQKVNRRRLLYRFVLDENNNSNNYSDTSNKVESIGTVLDSREVKTEQLEAKDEASAVQGERYLLLLEYCFPFW